MTSKRIYFRYRRAYAPRVWPSVIACIIILVPVDWLLFPLGTAGSLAAATCSVAIGLTVGIGRFEIWKRRHPIITADEYMGRPAR